MQNTFPHPVIEPRTIVAPRRAGGFTLLEVLVTLVILLTILAILMPMTKNLKLRVNETICATNTRQLINACMNYALDWKKELPDLSINYGSPSLSYEQQLYWSWPYWRKHLEENYGLDHIHWYCPSNPKWSLDRFYYWGWNGSNPDTATNFVMGRFYFSSTTANWNSFYTRLQPHSRPSDPTRAIFPRYLDDRRNAFSKMMWIDLNREWPSTGGQGNHFVTPGDPDRWGANHLYEADYGNPNDLWPSGANVGSIMGDVTWKSGADIRYRVTVNGTSDYFW